LDSRLVVLVAHLLKWRFQPERAGGSWLRTIGEQRQAIGVLLQRNPSLLPTGRMRLLETYERALRFAEKDAMLSRHVLPSQCPFVLDEVLDPAFLPATPER
jgi:hypothetical protein